MLHQCVVVLLDRWYLTAQKVCHCVVKAVVVELVPRACVGRQKAARDFVLALRARFEQTEVVLDAVVNALVVTGLEVQRAVLCSATPVASVQGVAATEQDGCLLYTSDAADD